MYELLLAWQARRDLDQLPAEVYGRIVPKIHSLASEPRPSGCRKLSGSANDYRVRVGDYRILYEVADDVREVRILRVRHRREVYR